MQMYRLLLIGMLICLGGRSYVSAQQWTKKDSIWLQNVLSGKEKLELNPETKKAIESGELINLDDVSKMQMAPAEPLPTTKDFSEYIHKRKVALKKLPPAVFWLYTPPRGVEFRLYQHMLESWRKDPMSKYDNGNLKFDVGEMTSKKVRVHKRNAKRDGTRRNYNNLPTPDIIKKKKKYAQQNPQAAGKDTLLLRKDSVFSKDTLPVNLKH